MKQAISDVHQQFAEYFNNKKLTPYLYLLSRNLSEGSTCVTLEEAQKKDFMQEATLIGNAKILDRPFIVDHDRLYMQRYYLYEKNFTDSIARLIRQESSVLTKRIERLRQLQPFVETLFPNRKEIDWQLSACVMAFCHNFHIVTGGPGTGKTTTIAKLLALVFKDDPNAKVVLAAPTGKASARMADSLKMAQFEGKELLQEHYAALEPSTIHRLLGARRESIYFHHDRNNPISADVVIVDESSMIDLALFSKLLDAIGDHTRLILLGDKDQLASVEAGSLLSDLCQEESSINFFTRETLNFLNEFAGTYPWSDTYLREMGSNILFEHITRLTVSHRFAGTSGIGTLSNAILNNDIVALQKMIQQPEEDVVFDVHYEENIFEQFVDGFKSYIDEEDIVTALLKLNSLKVLCATNIGPQGAFALNKRIEDILSRKKKIQIQQVFYHNRPIIVTQNNYALGLYNGDIGIIRWNEKNQPMAWFFNNDARADAPVKSVSPSLIGQLETVFAMTIHKSQGSEFDRILMVLPSHQNNDNFTRELLYTGITRAKKQVYIQSSETTFLNGCARQVSRSSGVAARL